MSLFLRVLLFPKGTNKEPTRVLVMRKHSDTSINMQLREHSFFIQRSEHGLIDSVSPLSRYIIKRVVGLEHLVKSQFLFIVNCLL
jgi:hypothetical protein